MGVRWLHFSEINGSGGQIPYDREHFLIKEAPKIIMGQVSKKAPFMREKLATSNTNISAPYSKVLHPWNDEK